MTETHTHTAANTLTHLIGEKGEWEGIAGNGKKGRKREGEGGMEGQGEVEVERLY